MLESGEHEVAGVVLGKDNITVLGSEEVKGGGFGFGEEEGGICKASGKVSDIRVSVGTVATKSRCQMTRLS
jgi:hypothetical protein